MSDGVFGGQLLAGLINALDSEPMFAMSLGSKELFHSNLLGWFISHHPPVAEALMGVPGRSPCCARSTTRT
jgi:hypothetical protein